MAKRKFKKVKPDVGDARKKPEVRLLEIEYYKKFVRFIKKIKKELDQFYKI